MRFVFACLLVLGAAAPVAAQQQPQPQQPQQLQQPPPQQQPAPEVPSGYESQPPAYPQQQPPPPPPGVGQPAYPAPPPQAPPEPEGALHSVSITFSPFHLVLPVFEVMGEFKVEDWFGIAAILGGGSVTVTDGFDEETFSAFELGSQVLFYPLGDFDHGLQLGLEALFIFISGSVDSGRVTGTGSGLAIGPLVGYKFAARWGLTIDIQGGVQVAGIAARASDGTTTEEDSQVSVIPLLNINAGWSF